MAYIQADNITYGYDNKQPVIKNISLTVDKNEVIAIVGDNGCGKTTLGKLLTGIVKPQEGAVWLDGCTTMEMELGDIGQRIGYLYQQPRKQIFASTVREQLLFVHELQGNQLALGEQRMKAILGMFQLEGKEEVSPHSLSHGELQRLALGSILFNKPRFLILDEPTIGLDHERINQLSHCLNDIVQEGIGMIIISHNTRFIRKHANRIITLREGEIVHDTRC